jgi:hypothetical protein
MWETPCRAGQLFFSISILPFILPNEYAKTNASSPPPQTGVLAQENHSLMDGFCSCRFAGSNDFFSLQILSRLAPGRC